MEKWGHTILDYIYLCGILLQKLKNDSKIFH